MNKISVSGLIYVLMIISSFSFSDRIRWFNMRDSEFCWRWIQVYCVHFSANASAFRYQSMQCNTSNVTYGGLHVKYTIFKRKV